MNSPAPCAKSSIAGNLPRNARINEQNRGGAPMLFTCLPEGARIPGRFPGPMHARGKWFTVDIHCHVTTPAAEEMVKGSGLENWQPRHHFANELTRQVNREQSARTRVQGLSV